MLKEYSIHNPYHCTQYKLRTYRRRLTFHRHSGCGRSAAFHRALACARINPFMPILPMHLTREVSPKELFKNFV